MSDEPSLPLVLRDWAEVFMRRSFSDFRRFIEDSDLSPSQVATLMRLMHCGSCGISDIAGHLGFTRPAASQMIERLVQQRLLKRTEDPGDRRIKLVTLTPEGRALIERCIEARRNWMEQLAATFTLEEQQNIASALTLLANAARQLEVEQE